MKYLITGYKGQLGYDIKRELLSRGIDDENIIAIDKDEMEKVYSQFIYAVYA